MNRTALSLVIFGIIYLLFFSLSYRRSKRWVVPAGEAQEVTLARRRSNRLLVRVSAAVVLGSWIGAAVIYLNNVDISHVQMNLVFTSILVLCWAVIVVIPTIRLRELSKKVALTGGADENLLKTIAEVKAVRLKMALLFGIMACLSLISSISQLISSPR